MSLNHLTNHAVDDSGHAEESAADQNHSVSQDSALDSSTARVSAASRHGLKMVSSVDEPTTSTQTSSNASSADKKLIQAVVQAKQSQLLASRQSAVIELVAHYLDQSNLQSGLVALAEELHQRFNCERVVIGLCDNHSLKVACISQQSSFDPQSGEIALLNDALQEACDQDAVIHFASDMEIGRQDLTLVEAHRAVLSGVRSAQVCTLPMCYQGNVIGGLMLEVHNADAWSDLTIELFKQIAGLSAPLIGLRRLSEQGVREKLKRSVKSKSNDLLGPRHAVLKLGLLAFGLTLFMACFIPVTHRLPANAELVSTEKRLITAPLNSYLESVQVSVGDAVEAGQVLLSLDTKDFQVEVERLEAALKTAESEYRSAMASYDRKAMAVAQALLQQTRSELDLLNGKISRSHIVAPNDGIVISGDLTQMLGAPVDRGQTLLEIAPAVNYQIQLKINESDVRFAEVGQRGTLTLKSSPLDEISFEVSAIHPIAVVGDNATQFRLDAIPTQNIENVVRPGQTGVAKIDVGSQRLIWVWTHRFVDWARLKLWSWFG